MKDELIQHGLRREMGLFSATAWMKTEKVSCRSDLGFGFDQNCDLGQNMQKDPLLDLYKPWKSNDFLYSAKVFPTLQNA